MPSNEGHVHWGGATGDVISYLGQPLQVDTNDTPGDPIGGIHIHAQGFAGTPLLLPNSSASTPRWDDIPGTSPILQARQDGHFPSDYIRIRQA